MLLNVNINLLHGTIIQAAIIVTDEGFRYIGLIMEP